MTVTLISLGNELRRDDGIAAELCNGLEPAIKSRLRHLDLGIHGDQIAFYIRDSQHAIVVDALLDPAEVGSLKVYSGLPFDSSYPNATHGFSWVDELKLASVDTPLTFVAVPVCDDGWGKGFSPEVKNRQGQLIQSLSKVCLEILETCHA